MEEMKTERGDEVGTFLILLVEAEVVAKGKFVVGSKCLARLHRVTSPC